jgi:hypothetical protein
MATYTRPGICGAPVSAVPISGGAAIGADIGGLVSVSPDSVTVASVGVIKIAAQVAITVADHTLSSAGAVNIAA